MEILLFPQLVEFGNRYGLIIQLAAQQNFYPDITFIDKSGNRFALDLKTTYRKNDSQVNGMTLGCFTGYFRERDKAKNITYPYNTYLGHFVLGVIYSQVKGHDDLNIYQLGELHSITSVINNFQFFAQEKYLIASDRPGSGNTRNIGSVTKIDDLIAGSGPFANLGREIFDDYWMFYLTQDMARAVDLPKRPYNNLASYIAYRNIGK